MGGSISTTASTLLALLKNPADPQAWAAFVDRYGPRVYAWCRASGLQEADCEDVTQQVLLKFVARAKSFQYDPAGSFRAWLKTVTRHAVADLFADFRRFRGSGDSQILEQLQQAQSRQTLEEELDQEFERELLEEALHTVELRVGADTWKAFQKMALEGRSGNEVAKELKMKVAAVYMAKSRVQKMVKEQLQKFGGQP